MGRIRRQYYACAIYHVYNRGNNGLEVLLADEDKSNFLKVVARYKTRFDFSLYGFVLMNNHYHLLVETKPRHDISRVMQAIQLAYGSQYRKRYRFVGQLWQSRFQSKIILTDSYLEECLAYIHHNPLKAGLVETAEEYSWSSAKAWKRGQDRKVTNVLSLDDYEDRSVANY